MPFSPVFDGITRELVRLDYLPTGTDHSIASTCPWTPVKKVKFTYDLLDEPLRTDLKPYIVQTTRRSLVLCEWRCSQVGFQCLFQFQGGPDTIQYTTSDKNAISFIGCPTLASSTKHTNYRSGDIELEVRATGIPSAMLIDHGATVPWGTNVGPGVMAGYHQHIFSMRIDPPIDGHNNTVVYQDSIPMPEGAVANPMVWDTPRKPPY
ncbi:hypothetical protein PABG_11200 [Paracoccidioides brasiliensis Pb03]|nr:hypothetical protein PABG_11200 [Paracoccidioides brasiliensis Pb03]